MKQNYQDVEATAMEIEEPTVPDTTSQVIFAHLSNDGIVADKVIDIPHSVSVKSSADTYTTTATYTTASQFRSHKKVKPPKKYGTDEDIAEVERDVVDMTRSSLGKAITNFTLEALIKMASNVGVNLWERITNEPIRKMRLIMEIKEAYFPSEISERRANAPVFPWRGIPIDKLLKKAEECNVTWKHDDNEGINRMRLIMALKKNNIQASDIEK